MFVHNSTTFNHGRYKIVAVHVRARPGGYHFEYHFRWKWQVWLCLRWMELLCPTTPDYEITVYRKNEADGPT